MISITYHRIDIDHHGISLTHHRLSVDHHGISITCHGIRITHRRLSADHHTNNISYYRICITYHIISIAHHRIRWHCSIREALLRRHWGNWLWLWCHVRGTAGEITRWGTRHRAGTWTCWLWRRRSFTVSLVRWCNESRSSPVTTEECACQQSPLKKRYRKIM